MTPFSHLCSLLIELPISNPIDPASVDINGRLRDIIPRGRRWANLTKLSLRNIECDGDELQELLLNHKDTLRELWWCSCALGSGREW